MLTGNNHNSGIGSCRFSFPFSNIPYFKDLGKVCHLLFYSVYLTTLLVFYMKKLLELTLKFTVILFKNANSYQLERYWMPIYIIIRLFIL